MPYSLGGNGTGTCGCSCSCNNFIRKNNDQHEKEMHYNSSKRRIFTKGFQHLWFGSYASSIIDSKRTIMTIDELVSLNGFSMNFKVVTTTMVPTAAQQRNIDDDHNNVHHHEDIQLHFQCMCYFDEDYKFRMEHDRVDGMETDVHARQENEEGGREGEGDRQQQNQFHQNSYLLLSN
jgi:hypothetical protein